MVRQGLSGQDWQPLLRPSSGAPGSLEMLAGGLAVGAGLHTGKRAAAGKPAPSPSNLSLPATLAFALASTASDLPTAIPLFAAVNQIAAAGTGLVARYGWLAFYNGIYVAPLVAMLAASLTLGQRADPALRRVRQAVDWTFARLLPPPPCPGRYRPARRRGPACVRGPGLMTRPWFTPLQTGGS